MKRRQLQIEVCKALLDSTNNRRCYCSRLNEKEIAITTTGFDAFIFNVDECVFDISRITEHKALSTVCEEHEKDIKISKTTEMFVSLGGKIIEKYKGENLVVYVDSALSKKFNGSGAEFFAHSPRERILVKDMFGRKIGAFLPLNIRDEKELLK